MPPATTLTAAALLLAVAGLVALFATSTGVLAVCATTTLVTGPKLDGLVILPVGVTKCVEFFAPLPVPTCGVFAEWCVVDDLVLFLV